MTLLGLGLVLLAAFCHASWNFFVKRINGGPELIWLFSAVSIVLYSPVLFYILFIHEATYGPTEFMFIAGSSLLHFAYLLLLQHGYRHGDLSLIYPTARATGPTLSTAFAVLMLGEHFTLQIAAGGLAIVTGVLFLTGGFGAKARHVAASLVYGLAVGVLIGSYTVVDAYAVSVVMISPITIDYASAIARAVLLAPIAYRRRDKVLAQWQDHRLGVFVIAILVPLAYIFVLYALTFTPVVYVAPAREVSVLIAVLMGSIFLGEGDLERRLIWAAVILLGMVLLATG